eukprot:SAG11_NODE_17303_length_522_cov_0.803783_1_plen_133_part_10
MPVAAFPGSRSITRPPTRRPQREKAGYLPASVAVVLAQLIVAAGISLGAVIPSCVDNEQCAEGRYCLEGPSRCQWCNPGRRHNGGSWTGGESIGRRPPNATQYCADPGRAGRNVCAAPEHPWEGGCFAPDGTD